MTTCFLGAMVLSYDIKGSFGGSGEIECSVNLTEANWRSPTFSPPAVGTPVLFKDGNFEFWGIFDTYRTEKSSSAAIQYSVQLTSGNFILAGVELILNDYYGSVNAVPNLINVFGYMESFGFGTSGVNSAGTSWSDIATSLTTIANTYAGSTYGNGITYKGNKYKLDISALPSIPTYYRINSDNINLLDFVSEVCSAGGHDFFFRLIAPTVPEAVTGWKGTFELVTISRITEPTPGQVGLFIETTPCVISNNYGIETRKDTHSKFVVGANLERIYFNYPQNSGDNSFDGGVISQDEYANDTVLPFFGTDANNDLIVGFTPSGEPNEYYFNINVSDIDCPISTGEYLTCLGELKAARKGRTSWERYLAQRDFNEYIIEPFGTGVGSFKTDFNFGPTFDAGGGDYYIPKFGYGMAYQLKGQSFANSMYTGVKYLRYNHNSNPNYFYRRASTLKLSNGYRFTFPRMLESDLQAKAATDSTMLKIYETFKSNMGIIESEWSLLNGDNLNKASRVVDDSLGNFNDNKTDQLYRRIKGVADTYYNRKFMVSIPYTLGTYEPESSNIRMSQDVINEGYIDESAWATAYSAGLIPNVSGINTLLSQDNKFSPFVKYENCVVLTTGGDVTSMLYDFSQVGEEDKVFNTPVNTGDGNLTYDCWVKCRVDEKTYFHDTQTLYGPRAVIELPGSVKVNRTADYPTYMMGLLNAHAFATGVGGAFYGDSSVDAAFLKKSFDKIGGDDALMHDGEDILYADLYAIPLRSKLLCYGPWYAIGADGKVGYERNQDLNPWNYGGFDAMNAAGLARVNDGITNQTISEVGSVTVKGAPLFNFGDILIAGGPYITDISCSFGSNGTTTTYGFQAWSSHRSLSKLNGYAVERNKRVSNSVKQMQSNFREGLRNGKFKNAGDFYSKVSNRFIDLNDYTRKERSSTSHKIFAGEVNKIGATVVAQPIYNAGAQAYTDYANKAYMSMDGLLRPVSTVEKSGWPSFEVPTATGATDINAYKINPFRSGNDIQALAYGTSISENGLLRGTGEITTGGTQYSPYRAMALRLPMVGVGWGYDLAGSPVPAGTGENGFADDYLYNQENWKAGPIDLRWDDENKVWTTLGNGGGGGTSVGDCGCGCLCADGYDLVLPDGTQTTTIMGWVPPGGLEIDVPNGHIFLPASNQVDTLSDLAGYYPLTYVAGSSGTWRVALSGYLEARYSDYISEVDGSTVRGSTATSGVTKGGLVTFMRDTGDGYMTITIDMSGTIASTG